MALEKFDVKPLISHRIALSEWEKGFELMESQKALKVLFKEFE
jgi:threonine dehydrogenase-like Zn-dependent dehydrogenase